MSESRAPSERSAHPAYLRDLLLGYFLLGLQPVAVRVVCQELSSMQAVFLRFSFAALCVVALSVLRRRFISTEQPTWFVARGVLGAVAVYLYFSSVVEVGAARATLLNYTYPLWANVFSLFLGARPSRRFWFGLTLAFLGVFIIVAPVDASGLLTLRRGDVEGLLSAIVAGAAVLVVKQLRTTDDATSIVGAFTVGGLVISAWGHDRTAALGALFHPDIAWAAWTVGVTSFFGHIFFTRGYKGATVQQATLLSLLVPVLAALLGGVVLGEPIGMRFLLGASFVLLALGYAGQHSSARVAQRVSESPTP